MKSQDQGDDGNVRPGLPHDKAVRTATVVNAGAVLLMALGLCAAGFVGLFLDNKAVVSAASLTSRVLTNLIQVVFVLMAFTPAAVIAGWRTWVHSHELLNSQYRT